MLKRFQAVYRDGVFIPNEPCQLAENTEVNLVMSPSHNNMKEMIDSDVRKEILHALLRRIRQTSLAKSSAPLTSTK